MWTGSQRLLLVLFVSMSTLASPGWDASLARKAYGGLDVEASTGLETNLQNHVLEERHWRT